MRTRFRALAVAAAVSAIAVPAAAAGPDSVRVARASAVVQQAGADALAGATKAKASPEASPAATAEEAVQKSALSVVTASSQVEAQASERPEPPRPTCRLGEGCSYRTLLGYLVITKDLEIPGAPVMALRLIPTHSSLAGGATAPIVLKPRVVGTSWSGLEIAAKF
jgi:hypothetical protein